MATPQDREARIINENDKGTPFEKWDRIRNGVYEHKHDGFGFHKSGIVHHEKKW